MTERQESTPPPPPPPSPPTRPPTTHAAVGPPRRRGVPMVLRHILGVVLALVVTPIAILVFDYGAGRYQRERALFLDDGELVGELATMVAGMVLLAVVAASSRISGLGPLLAGLVWGVAPFVWFAVDLASFYEFSSDLPSDHLWFGWAAFLFPLVAALLVGAGLGGRWLPRKA